MPSIKDELANDSELIRKIRRKLPRLFQIAELESSRAGKVGMEVGSLREKIVVAMLLYKFSDKNVETEIPITEPEVDVKVFQKPISIKTLTSHGFGGVKLSWTVDAQNAAEFKQNYEPRSDMIFVQIHWENDGGFYYIPLHVQQEVLKEVGRSHYIKLPALGKNPRGSEITAEALEQLAIHSDTLKIKIHWKKETIQYDQFERWVKLWEEN